MYEDNNNLVETNRAEETEVEEVRSGMGTGAALLTGGLLTLAAIAIGKKVKEVYTTRKLMKEQASKSNGSEVIDITDEVTESNETEDEE